MRCRVKIEHAQLGNDPLRPTAAQSERLARDALMRGVADGRNKIDLFDETEDALPGFIHRGAVSAGPDGEMLDIGGEVAATAAARQLDARGIGAPYRRNIQVAVAIDLHAGEKHAPHIAARRYIKQVTDTERQHAPTLQGPVVRGWRKKGRLRVDAIGRAFDMHHARRMCAFRQQHRQRRHWRAVAVKDQLAVADGTRYLVDYHFRQRGVADGLRAHAIAPSGAVNSLRQDSSLSCHDSSSRRLLAPPIRSRYSSCVVGSKT